MIRSFYGLTHNPFDARDLQLLPQQQEIHDTLKVHCQQGGLCLVLGAPGTCPLPRSDRILGRRLPNCYPIRGCWLHREFGNARLGLVARYPA